MSGMKANTSRAVDTIWNYLQIGDDPISADCLWALVSRDDQVANYATEQAQAQSCETIVISGGTAHHNDLLATNWAEATGAGYFHAFMR